MKAVVIDGGQALRSMIGYVLETEGYEVWEAAGTPDVRGLLEQGIAPDVVVTCQNEDGCDLLALKLLKAHPLMNKVPVVLVARHEELDRQMEWKDAGVTCWLTWPITIEELLEMVRTVSFPARA
jgi:DNA-binding response OmpR family regulator